jgi:hypothetical protein
MRAFVSSRKSISLGRAGRARQESDRGPTISRKVWTRVMLAASHDLDP